MDRVVRQLGEFLREPVVEAERVNCHHNFTQRETHVGRAVWVSRKGAIEARQGQLGLIPGSMGTALLRRRGAGERAVALLGAARRRARSSRAPPPASTSPATSCAQAMAGIEYRDTDAFLDEIPGAYKDIDQVMADAADLVSVRHTLRQLLNVKGD